MRVELEAPVVLVPGVDALWHIPRRWAPGGWGAPATREALCGLHGDIYVYGGLVRERRACAVCRTRNEGADQYVPANGPLGPETELALVPAEPAPCRVCARLVEWSRGDAGDYPLCSLCDAQGNRGLPFGSWKRDELLALYHRYVLEGLTIRELALPHWRGKGYANERAAVSSIRQAWGRNGWPMRRRWESKQLHTKRVGRRTPARIPVAELRRMHVLHLERDVSINQLGREFHRHYGYRRALTCAKAIRQGWIALGLKARDRIEMTVAVSTKHGLKRRKGSSSALYKRYRAEQKGEQYDKPCAATTRRGQPCRGRAMLGRDVCQLHAPERHRELAEHMVRMRQRSPKHDPANLTTLAESGLQRELAEHWNQVGGWKQLAEASGYSNTQLRRWLIAPGDKVIMRDTVARVRAALTGLNAIAAGVTIQVGRPLTEHGQALMDTLGVHVDVVHGAACSCPDCYPYAREEAA